MGVIISGITIKKLVSTDDKVSSHIFHSLFYNVLLEKLII